MELQLYRRRLIPDELILLKDDIVLSQTPETIVTKWKTIRPKPDFDHGLSCYFLEEGFKVSKFYRTDGSLLYTYCDIVEYVLDSEKNTVTVTDLLADVVIFPDGFVKVVDLDELADAFEKRLISETQLNDSLRKLNRLLGLIYQDKFDKMVAPLEKWNTGSEAE